MRQKRACRLCSLTSILFCPKVHWPMLSERPSPRLLLHRDPLNGHSYVDLKLGHKAHNNYLLEKKAKTLKEHCILIPYKFINFRRFQSNISCHYLFEFITQHTFIILFSVKFSPLSYSTNNRFSSLLQTDKNQITVTNYTAKEKCP